MSWGLDRRETGLFCPTDEFDTATVITGSAPGVTAIRNAFAGPETQFLILQSVGKSNKSIFQILISYLYIYVHFNLYIKKTSYAGVLPDKLLISNLNLELGFKMRTTKKYKSPSFLEDFGAVRHIYQVRNSFLLSKRQILCFL